MGKFEIKEDTLYEDKKKVIIVVGDKAFTLRFHKDIKDQKELEDLLNNDSCKVFTFVR